MRSHEHHSVFGRLGVAAALILAILISAIMILAILLCADNAAAFELDADRDAFTPSTYCVEPGRSLTEGSYVFIDNPTGLPTNNYPELLVRLGVNEW